MAQKITIDPVTRIEGHAKVTIHLDDQGNVEQSFFHVNQFRGFEKFSEGRMYFEMPLITPRICGICPVSHHLAAAKACDALLGIEPPRPAQLLRELMHMGQTIQSHSMHFFHLASPDLLFGFDAPPEQRNVVAIIEAAPELALKAVKLRKYGQQIIERLGDKRVHPNFAIPGGVNRQLTIAQRDEMLSELDEMQGYVQEAIQICVDWATANMDTVLEFGSFDSGYMGLVNDHGGLDLFDGAIRLVDKEGKKILDFPASDYLEHIAERVEEWSYLKFPYYKELGWPDGTYRVGPLGRLNAVDGIDTPLAQAEFQKYRSLAFPAKQSLLFHYARLIEDLYAVERTRELLEDPEILSNDLETTGGKIQGEGVGVIEAPRGTLLHHYQADEHGQLTKVNLIVSTGHNNWAMSQAVDQVAKTYVDGSNLTEGMLNRVEAAIRCYDPCLSCSTHALGQMPLSVELVSSDGNVLDEARRG